MNIVITMAGLGSRFRKAGYTVPKYMIEVHEKTLFGWSMLSLAGFNTAKTKYIFIVRTEDKSLDFIAAECAKLAIRDYHVIGIDYLTDGQATTALLGAEYWKREQPLLIYNIDTYVEPNAMTAAQIKGDGFIPCFKAGGEHWSFVKLGSDDRAVEVAEKRRISDNCTLGAYYFKSCALYEKLYEEYYLQAANAGGSEKYVAPLYNHMIRNNQEVYISLVDYDKVHVLGTPEELEVFKHSYSPYHSR